MPAKIPDSTMAMILAECEIFGDDIVAKRWGVSLRSIGSYRRRQLTDSTFASICLHKKAELAEGWVTNATQCLCMALTELTKRYPTLKTREDAECLQAIASSLKIVGELRLAFDALSGQSPES